MLPTPAATTPAAQVDVLERELDTMLRKRRARLGAPILRALFGFGGYQLDNAKAKGCTLPADIDPQSTNRFWAGMQFNGNPSRCVSACVTPRGA